MSSRLNIFKVHMTTPVKTTITAPGSYFTDQWKQMDCFEYMSMCTRCTISTAATSKSQRFSGQAVLSERKQWCNNKHYTVWYNCIKYDLKLQWAKCYEMGHSSYSTPLDNKLHGAQVEFFWSALASLRFLAAGIQFLNMLWFPRILWTSFRLLRWCKSSWNGYYSVA